MTTTTKTALPTNTQPPPAPSYLLTVPPSSPHTLLITINRPRTLNSLPSPSHWEASRLLSWFDTEPTLRVAVITGAGDKAFCAGQDLAEQGRIAELKAKGEDAPHEGTLMHPPAGFMGVSRRAGRKPVVAAVNGVAFGGGFEIVLNCDMILASPRASFSLPESKRGLYAAAGGLSRLVRLVGLPIASEVAMAGRVLSAAEARDMRIVNRVSATHESLVPEALELARKISEESSPDAVVVTKSGLREGLEQGSVEEATRRTEERFGRALKEGENLRIGVQAFVEKRKPRWVDSKL